MLHMVNRRLGLFIYFFLYIALYAGVQTVDIGLDLSYEGASQKIINNKMVIDLGFLKQGTNYIGANNIKIGTVTVKISQKISGEESGCLLEDMEFNSVNIKKLERYSERISTVDKIYVGGNNNITLTANNIRILSTQGDISSTEEEYYFVSPECLTEGVMEGVALTSLEYQFDLYADISGEIPMGTVVGAFGQNDNGVAISIKDLISNQINNSIITRGKRRK